jgi:hypothetical protein
VLPEVWHQAPGASPRTKLTPWCFKRVSCFGLRLTYTREGIQTLTSEHSSTLYSLPYLHERSGKRGRSGTPPSGTQHTRHASSPSPGWHPPRRASGAPAGLALGRGGRRPRVAVARAVPRAPPRPSRGPPGRPHARRPHPPSRPRGRDRDPGRPPAYRFGERRGTLDINRKLTSNLAARINLLYLGCAVRPSNKKAAPRRARLKGRRFYATRLRTGLRRPRYTWCR